MFCRSLEVFVDRDCFRPAANYLNDLEDATTVPLPEDWLAQRRQRALSDLYGITPMDADLVMKTLLDLEGLRTLVET